MLIHYTGRRLNTRTEVAPDEANAANAAMLIPVFRIRHPKKTYGKGEVKVRALKDVNLEIWRSEFIVLLGASGTGKSTCSISAASAIPTLRRVMAGLRPPWPLSSWVTIGAPIEVRVLRVIQTGEAMVTLCAPLIELGDLHKLEVVAELLTPGASSRDPAVLCLSNRRGGTTLRGRVRKVEPAAFTKTSCAGRRRTTGVVIED